MNDLPARLQRPMKSGYAIHSIPASIHFAMSNAAPSSTEIRLRTRPIAVGHLRALEAVARPLNFRAAAEELSLTQSAVSRQVQALEEEVGVPLFLRHPRAVELTSAGSQLLRAVVPSLERMDR